MLHFWPHLGSLQLFLMNPSTLIVDSYFKIRICIWPIWTRVFFSFFLSVVLSRGWSGGSTRCSCWSGWRRPEIRAWHIRNRTKSIRTNTNDRPSCCSEEVRRCHPEMKVKEILGKSRVKGYLPIFFGGWGSLKLRFIPFWLKFVSKLSKGRHYNPRKVTLSSFTCPQCAIIVW